MRAVVGVVARERRDISVAAAVNQAIRVGNDGRSGERLILAVGWGDRDGGREAEPYGPSPADPSSGTTGVRMSGLIDVRRLKNDA